MQSLQKGAGHTGLGMGTDAVKSTAIWCPASSLSTSFEKSETGPGGPFGGRGRPSLVDISAWLGLPTASSNFPPPACMTAPLCGFEFSQETRRNLISY